MPRTSLRLAAVAAAVAPALLATSVPAQAAAPDSYFSRSSGFVGAAAWTQVLPIASFGNVHVGELYAFESSPGRADVFSFIEDYECPTGQLPGSHGDPGGCEYLGSRTLDGESVSFVVARKSTSATLSGTLTARTAGDPHSGEGGATLGQVPASFTWTASGAAVRSREVHRSSSGSTTWSNTINRLSTPATLAGRLGPMLFEQAASATGSLDSFRSTDRSRT